MANRVVGSVIIVDSAMGNSFLVEAATGNYRNYKVNSIILSMADTSAVAVFTQTNTTDIVMRLDRNWAEITFASPQYFENLKVPTLTNGTAWIYLA